MVLGVIYHVRRGNTASTADRLVCVGTERNVNVHWVNASVWTVSNDFKKKSVSNSGEFCFYYRNSVSYSKRN